MPRQIYCRYSPLWGRMKMEEVAECKTSNSHVKPGKTCQLADFVNFIIVIPAPFTSRVRSGFFASCKVDSAQ